VLTNYRFEGRDTFAAPQPGLLIATATPEPRLRHQKRAAVKQICTRAAAKPPRARRSQESVVFSPSM